MTLEEFLRWEDGTDTRYELVRGVPVPRPLQPNAHGMLLARLCSLIDPGLEARQKHFGLPASAVASPNDPGTCYLADFVVAPLPITVIVSWRTSQF
ncbi:MAG TPA: Uma2 family endonuclease [Stellaceae bacterium]|nr:Uma2 family endonuclease [Stellaceae bacterium]